jgi:ketosteroid isomerase-like protein
MKFLWFVTLIIGLKSVCGQDFSAELQSMVDAENTFAKYSKEKNTRDAFLTYLTDSTVLFDKNGPVKGKNSWVQRSPNNSLLFWYPEFVGISTNGDLGFSAGPWEWSPTKETPKPEAHGYYATIWQKYPEGWKMALDIGANTPGPGLKTIGLRASNPRTTKKKESAEITKDVLIALDKNYSDKLIRETAGFLPDHFSKDGLIIRTGSFPDYYPFKNLSDKKKTLKFSPMDGDIASSKDLAYIYGRVEYDSVKDGIESRVNASFLRVWKIENGEWKIVLDVVGAAN